MPQIALIYLSFGILLGIVVSLGIFRLGRYLRLSQKDLGSLLRDAGRRLRAWFASPGEPAPPAHAARWPEWVTVVSVLVLVVVFIVFTPIVHDAQSGGTPQAFLPSLQPLRDSFIAQTSKWMIAIALGAAALFVWIRTTSSASSRATTPRLGFLLAAFTFALEGQLACLKGITQAGALLYAAGALLLVMWWRRYGGEASGHLEFAPISRRLEVWALAAILILTAATRFYRLGDIPYGIEGDELKWTAEAVSLMVDGQDLLDSNYHFTSVPVSFYMQAPFHRLLPPGILAVRTEVAVFSVLATLVFYFLLKELANTPVALVGTFLLAISPVDISASRLGNVESHVKLWSILPFFLLVTAIRWKRPALFFLCGLSIALALLTYDTLAPVLPIAGLYLLLQIFRAKSEGKQWILRFVAFLVPVAWGLTTTMVYWNGRGGYYDFGHRGWGDTPLRALASGAEGVLTNLFRETSFDFLFNRPGPIVESPVTPFLVLGAILAVLNPKRRGYLLLLLWFGGTFFFVPVFLASPMVRVVYPGFPSIYALAAVSMVLLGKELRSVLGSAASRTLASAGILAAGLLLLNNLFVYFNLVEDPEDRVRRREVSDLVVKLVDAGRIVYGPYIPSVHDVLEDEQNTIRLGLRSRMLPSEISLHYRPVALDQLLLQVGQEKPPTSGLSVLFDRVVEERQEERQAAMEAFLRCYDPPRVESSRTFDVYHFDAHTLSSPQCATAEVTLSAAGQELPADEPVELSWTSDYGPPQIRALCESPIEGAYVIEGEDFQIENGWTALAEFASDFHGKGFLVDGLNGGVSRRSIEVASSGEYSLWVRSYRRQDDAWPGYLGAGGDRYAFSADRTAPRDVWIWEKIGSVRLQAGAQELKLERPFEEDAMYFKALFVDQIILTSSPAFNPETSPVFQSAFDETAPTRRAISGSFAAVLAPGSYICRAQASDGNYLIDSDGQIGVWSDPVRVEVAR